MEPFIEKKKLNEISKRWEEAGVFRAKDDSKKPKKYVLDMFPYPSGDGLHVGHVESYTGSDIVARYYRMKGYNVLHPVGWDAFGLPAENYAIKQGAHPRESTQNNIANFTRQIKSLGFSYDWSREINTSDPNYYKWTQWLFLKLYERGLAYKKRAKANWCDSCQTVLANEQVVDGACERCGSMVRQKELEQWFFKITDYAERLIDDLNKLDWPDNIKTMQRNWIGKSSGVELLFDIENSDKQIKVFTTRPDTLFGVTYVVLAPEHPLVDTITIEPRVENVTKYRTATEKKSVLERAELNEKTGVFTGAYALHPITRNKLPVWVADYVITEYGGGAVMAVPAHDKRDFEFAKKNELPIIEVVSSSAGIDKKAYTGDGNLINSGEFDGVESVAAKDKITKKAGGKKKTQYRLRDWLVSRQRYWGAPIPVIYCSKCLEKTKNQKPKTKQISNHKCQTTVINGKEYAIIPVPESDLPVRLPEDVDFRPTGESPLAKSKSFHSVVCPICGGSARRESDTMDTFVCSSWYFLRFCDPDNGNVAFDAEKARRWMPVDVYIGGAEHAVLHLLYARFITKVLFDEGNIKVDEPFAKLRNQGTILGPDRQKMSKSRGNVINPDEIVDNYGPDVLRLHEMFMGPFDLVKPWDSKSIEGVFRFIKKLIKFYQKAKPNNQSVLPETAKLARSVAIKIENEQFNTCVSDFMKHMNCLENKQYSRADLDDFLKIISPFMPYTAELLWQQSGHSEVLAMETWPEQVDETKPTKYTVVVQVNGKLRGIISVPVDADKDTVARAAQQLPSVRDRINDAGADIIYVPNKVINYIIK